MTPSNRRKLLSGTASVAGLLLARPALAQSRRPYGQGFGWGDGFDEGYDEPRPRRRRAAPRDAMYDRSEEQPNLADPYDGYPYGSRRQPIRPAEPEQLDLAMPGGDGGFDPRAIYAARAGEPFAVPAFNYSRVAPEFWRRQVDYRGREAAGTIVVDPRARHLYLVEGGGRAIRYGVGVGRQGFGWSGVATVNSKQAWPDWYPPREMIERDPRLARSLSELQSGIGLHGGPGNPLGARALYLWQGGKDTLYRVHGTVEPWTIGTRVSSGCIRMVNQDAMDLYGRAGLGASVVVLG